MLISYDADSVRQGEVVVPPLVERLFRHKGASGRDFRRHLNNLVCVVADEGRGGDAVLPKRCRKSAGTRQRK
jgi:hypothetical protein